MTLTAEGNTYSGGTTIDSGRLISEGATTLGTGAVLLDGGILDSLTSAPALPNTVMGFGGNGDGWTTNGNAATAIANDVVTMGTDPASQQPSSLWLNTPVHIRAFTIGFTYTPSPSQLTGGVALVLQDSLASTGAIGAGGDGLGYQGLGQSVAVALNFDSATTIGAAVLTGGAVPSDFDSVSPVDLTSGNPIAVTVTYDGTTLFVTYAEQGTDHVFESSQAIELPDDIGSSLAYLGFTGDSATAASACRRSAASPTRHPIRSQTSAATAPAGLSAAPPSRRSSTISSLCRPIRKTRRTAWYSTPLNIDAFTVQFTYTPSGNKGGDGIAFVIQNDPNQTNALGSNGTGLGYAGISDSLAVALSITDGQTGYAILQDGAAGQQLFVDRRRRSQQRRSDQRDRAIRRGDLVRYARRQEQRLFHERGDRPALHRGRRVGLPGIHRRDRRGGLDAED